MTPDPKGLSDKLSGWLMMMIRWRAQKGRQFIGKRKKKARKKGASFVPPTKWYDEFDTISG